MDKRFKEKLVVDIFGKEIDLVSTCSCFFSDGDLRIRLDIELKLIMLKGKGDCKTDDKIENVC